MTPRRAGLGRPTLVGPEHKIRRAAADAGLDIGRYRLVDAAHSHEAAEKAVALVRAGEAEVLMKGSLHTDELMGAVVRRETGLRTERRVNHCFIMDVPSYPKPLVVTDAAINIFPKPDRASATRPPARRIHGSPASAVMSIPPSAVGDGSAVGTSGWPLRPQRRPGPAGFRGPLSRATERTR